jgi:hypothetical protein
MRRMLFAVLVCVGFSGCAFPQLASNQLRGECPPYGTTTRSRGPTRGGSEPDISRPQPPLLGLGCEGVYSPRPMSSSASPALSERDK